MLYRKLVSKGILLGAAITGAGSSPIAKAQSAAREPNSKIILDLDLGEPYEAMVFHGDYLWVGQSRKDFNADYRVRIIDRNDKVAGEVRLNHAVSYLHPYADDAVIAVGTGHTPNLTHYTVIRVLGKNSFNAQTRVIPEEAWGHNWIGTLDGKEYLLDFSGKYEDADSDQKPSRAGRTVFTMDASDKAEFLGFRIPAPTAGFKLGDEFFVTHYYQIGGTLTNVVRVNPRSGAMTTLFPKGRQQNLDVKPVAGGKGLALSEYLDDRIAFYDLRSGAVTQVVASAGGPRSLVTLGRCVLAGNEKAKTVSVIDASDLAAPKLLASIGIDDARDAFRGLRKLAVDPQTGRLYGRSAYPCNPMIEDCNRKSWNRVIASNQKVGQAVLEACR